MTMLSERDPRVTYAAGVVRAGPSVVSVVVRAIEGSPLTLDGSSALLETAAQISRNLGWKRTSEDHHR